MIRFCLVAALMGGATAHGATAVTDVHHNEVWDAEWDEARVEWEIIFGKMLAAIRARRSQEAHDMVHPLTGTLARINTLGQRTFKRHALSTKKAVAAILIDGSRRAIAQQKFHDRTDLDILQFYLTTLINEADYRHLKEASRQRVRGDFWRALGYNSVLFVGPTGFGSGLVAAVLQAAHVHPHYEPGTISVGAGVALGGLILKAFRRRFPRGVHVRDENLVKPRLIDCRRLLAN